MAKRISIALITTFAAAVLFVAYRLYDRFPWLETSVYAHSERGSTNCGHLTNSSYEPHVDPDPVIRCVVSAHQQHRPFFVTLNFHGIDEQVTSAIIGDSKGRTIEIFYAMGYVERPNSLLRRRCDNSSQFLVQQKTVYDVPRLHCQPWPPPTLERDHIFW